MEWQFHCNRLGGLCRAFLAVDNGRYRSLPENLRQRESRKANARQGTERPAGMSAEDYGASNDACMLVVIRTLPVAG
jgi:hypothetical protein